MPEPNYGRDIDIGKPPTEKYNVDVDKIESIVTSTAAAAASIEEAIAELRKIKTGTGLSISVDLDEEVE